MPEIFCTLLGFLAFLLIIAVVGHGLWVVLTVVVRAISGENPHSIGLSGSKRDAEEERLRITVEVLEGMLAQGEISREACIEGLEGVARSYIRNRMDAPIWLQTRIDLIKAGPAPAALPIPAAPQQEIVYPVAAAQLGVQTPEVEIVEAELVEVAPPPRTPWDEPDRPPAPAPVLTPRKSLADILQSFMEESNIRWGEIIAGLCIVVSAIGLVVSLRNALKSVPYFPAILFLVFTLAFHGAALYTLRRWKLQVVSRVALLICLLLLPLNFAAGVMLGGNGDQIRPLTDPLVLIASAVGVAAGSWIAISACQALLPARGWIVGVGIVVCSLSEVVLRRFAPSATGLTATLLLGFAPLAALVASVSAMVTPLRWRKSFGPPHASRVFTTLGTALFAFLTPLVILLVDSPDRRARLAELSPLLTVAGAIALSASLLVERRTQHRRFALIRFLALAVALICGAALLAAFAAAWPKPLILAIVCGMLALAFGLLTWSTRLAPLALPAVIAGTLCWTMLVHLFTGSLDADSTDGVSLLQWLSSGRTAWLLLPAALAAIGLARLKAITDEATKRYLLGGGAAVIATSALVALFSGFIPLEAWAKDRSFASPLLLLYGTALIAAAPQIGRFAAPLGASLFWSGLMHALWQSEPVRTELAKQGVLPEHPVHLATLSCAVLFALLGGVAAIVCLGLTPIQLGGKSRRTLRDAFSEPLAWCGLISAVAAAPNALWPDLHDLTWNIKAAAALTTATAGVFIALRKPWIISALQAALALSFAYFAAWWKVPDPKLGSQDWIAAEHLLVQLLFLALGVLIWTAARWAISKNFLFREFAASPFARIDLGLQIVGLTACAVLVFVRLINGIGVEIADLPHRPDLAAFPPWKLTDPAFCGIWLPIAILATTIAYLERPSWPRLLLVGLASGLALPLGAIAFEPANATASALRWICAGVGIGLSAILLSARYWRRAIPARLQPREDAPPGIDVTPLWLAGIPVLLLTALAVGNEIAGVAPGGPLSGTFFRQIGQVVSHGAPLFVVSAIYLAYALAKRQPALAAGSSAIFQFGINLAFLLYAKNHLNRGPVLGIDWLIWNALAAGVFGLVWNLLFTRLGSDTTWGRRLHLAQITIAARLGAGIAFVLAGWITVRIAPAAITLQTGGGWMAYLAVGVGIAPLVWRLIHVRTARWGRLTLAGIGLLAPLVAFSLGAAFPAWFWLPHRTLEVGFGICLFAAAVIANFRPANEEYARRDRNWIGYGGIFLAFWMLILAIGGSAEGDPLLGWQEGCCAVAALGCIACGLILGWELHALVSVIAASLAAVLSIIPDLSGASPSGLSAAELAFLPLRGISAALFASLIWQARAIWEERQTAREALPAPNKRTVRWVHHVAALICLPIACLGSLAVFVVGMPEPYEPTRLGYSIFHFAGLVIPVGFYSSALWDRRGRYALASLFILGLLSLLPAVSIFPLPARHLVPSLSLAVGLDVALCGTLFALGANLAAWGKKAGIPEVVEGLKRLELWLPLTLALFAANACGLALFTVLASSSLSLRTAVGFTPFAAGWGVAAIAGVDRRSYARTAGILLAVLGAVLLSWAQLPPQHTSAEVLERAFRVLVVLCAATLLLGLILPRWILYLGAWRAAVRAAGLMTAVASFVALGVTLAMEVVHFQSGLPSPSDLHVAVVAIALVGLIAGLISLALLPSLGLSRWSEDRRMAFVYGAQATGGLLFAHLYFCRPQWFEGILIPYWPYILMGVAFASAGVGEIFQRSKIRVLSEPFQGSGLFLPLLPMLGIWLHAGQTDRALVLFVGAILYLLSTMSTKSWLTLGAAIVAGNASLWTLFSERGFEFIHNPQMWLIPPAVCVLIAAQTQRHRLDARALAAIRYAATIVIYVSSTSEIFLRGMGREFWPPLILMGLSVAGAMLGIALRIRAFLFLGFAFMLVSLTSMVWYASTALFSHVWPWWAFGIGVGIAILILFGYFEKNRAQVQALIERLHSWEA